VKILLKEPEEIENPYKGEQLDYSEYKFTSERRAYDQGFYDGARRVFDDGKQSERKAWQSEVVDADLDKMARDWLLYVINDIHSRVTPFSQYLKEQLEVKHDTAES